MTDLQRAHNDWLDPDSPRVGRRVEVSDEWLEDRRMDERMESMSVDDGGPAFPGTAIANPGEWAIAPVGMSLRDYFAAKAMQALISIGANAIKERKDANGNLYDDPDQPWYFGNWEASEEKGNFFGVTALACDAYYLADAMLAERKKAKP